MWRSLHPVSTLRPPLPLFSDIDSSASACHHYQPGPIAPMPMVEIQWPALGRQPDQWQWTSRERCLYHVYSQTYKWLHWSPLSDAWNTGDAMSATLTTGSDPLEHIADRCREELIKYRETGKNDQQPCLDLWRKALREHSNQAWQHITQCFAPYLKSKFDHSALAREVMRRRSRSATQAQAVQSLIDDGFSELAKGNLRHPLEMRDLGSLLNFLWLCAENLMRMELRRPPVPSIPEGFNPPASPGFSKQPIHRVALAEAATVLRGCARNDRDHRAGMLLIFLQYTPQEVARSERYQSEFPDVHELHLIKARLLKCLREHLE